MSDGVCAVTDASRRHPWADVPATAGDRLRPVVLGTGDEIIATVRAEIAEYALSMDGEFGRRIRLGVSVALDQFLDLLGTDDALPDTTVYFELGRVEHRHGRTMDALQSAYRIGSRVLWRRIAAASEGSDGSDGSDGSGRNGTGGAHAPDDLGLGADDIFRLAEALFAYIEQLAAASVSGYAYEQSLAAGSRQARQHALVERLCRTPAPEPSELESLAREAGWTPPKTLGALVLAEESLAVACRRLPAEIAASAVDGVGVVFVPDPDGPGRVDALADALRGTPAVLGPTVTPDQVPRTVTRARAAWALQQDGSLPGEGLVRSEDHLLVLLLHADVTLTADLVAQRLEPLRRMTSAARDRAVTTLTAWLDAHGDVGEAATRLHVHPQTVRYRLARLKEAFAGVLDDPVGRLEVALALRAGGPGLAEG
ncbi:helix-turn-helix domain-containing protein [Actinomycetospora lutea]|uniref:PucR family transcriptional regulator n=1 Tax=Actinomycetospora lutea TaxID=663604 RepID=UPI0023650519|nr:helix-turn-helix domain-containing protein [Actinomycetospora lutea]MDD7937020.1 helix-turn-helix domain-containing protein [Actinomycetospora lutea]